ncbi:TetR/AcrR family transcriptional regulator [Williamsia muralis]|uniref:TetR/AcrR family transcriptional regulator n=1 Tax=Williamsia marianensis TaxID=85044 RepID=UPI00380BE6B8
MTGAAPRFTTSGARTSVAIREAAAKLFYEQGYEATSLRGVASEVDLRVGSLYNHIKGKEDLLADIMLSVLNDLLELVTASIEAAGPTLFEKFTSAMDCHIRYHAEHAREVFIGNSELRSLSPNNLAMILAKRAEYERLLHELIISLSEETGANILDAKLQTYAVLAQGAHVSSWYRSSGSKSLDKVVSTYIRLAVRQLGIERGVPAMVGD